MTIPLAKISPASVVLVKANSNPCLNIYLAHQRPYKAQNCPKISNEFQFLSLALTPLFITISQDDCMS